MTTVVAILVGIVIKNDHSVQYGKGKDLNKPACDLSQQRSTPGRPKDLEKRAAILDAAKRLFPEQGFDGTSMDAIATAAGVSKLTVYSHFNDKESLFVEAIRDRCDEQLPVSLFDVPVGDNISAQLMPIARAFFGLVASPPSIAMHRLLTAGTKSSAKLSQLFWKVGPVRAQEGFACFLHRADEAGKLEVADPMRAASQFFSLLKGELHLQMTMGCCEKLSDAMIDEHLAATVDTFVRAYERR